MSKFQLAPTSSTLDLERPLCISYVCFSVLAPPAVQSVSNLILDYLLSEQCGHTTSNYGNPTAKQCECPWSSPSSILCFSLLLASLPKDGVVSFPLYSERHVDSAENVTAELWTEIFLLPFFFLLHIDQKKIKNPSDIRKLADKFQALHFEHIDWKVLP